MKKKKYLIIAFICLLIIVILCLILDGCQRKNDSSNEEAFKTIDNLSMEINQNKKVSDLVEKSEKITLKNGNDTIDTSTLGEKEIILKYEENNEEKEKTIKVSIVDTTAPSIEYQKEVSTTVGKKIDLLKDVKVTDNSKEEIKVTVEGEYNINKEGTYNLKYIAVDSSNNKKEEDFTLKVTKKVTSTNNVNKTTKQTTNNGNTANKGTLAEFEAELDRLDAVRKTKSVLYTYDPTNEINALINPKFRNNISPDIYKRVFYYTCEQTSEGGIRYYTQCDGGDKGCNEKAVNEFKKQHPYTECVPNGGEATSPKYTYYVHSGYTGQYLGN